MTIKHPQCITVACDRCGAEYEQDEVTAHFASEADASSWVAETESGWCWDDTGIVCSRCIRDEREAACNHDWQQVTQRSNRCLRCDGHQRRPAELAANQQVSEVER